MLINEFILVSAVLSASYLAEIFSLGIGLTNKIKKTYLTRTTTTCSETKKQSLQKHTI
jgi:hypothetical protein